jgi:hypothetical protein
MRGKLSKIVKQSPHWTARTDIQASDHYQYARREKMHQAIDCALRAACCAVAMTQSVTGNAVMTKQTLQTTVE